jgi:hypothetical protein
MNAHLAENVKWIGLLLCYVLPAERFISRVADVIPVEGVLASLSGPRVFVELMPVIREGTYRARSTSGPVSFAVASSGCESMTCDFGWVLLS